MDAGWNIRAQFSLPPLEADSRGCLPIQHGEVFRVVGKSVSGLLDVVSDTSGRQGRVPRPSEAYYVDVLRSEVPFPRPVILLGSLRSFVSDLLLARQPGKFGQAVPHTTRPPRPHEKNGAHYWFVKPNTMDQMIKAHLFLDAGSLGGVWYGTTEAAVRTVAIKEARHCLLDSPHSIAPLLSRGCAPIVILVAAREWRQLHNVLQFSGVGETQAREEAATDTVLEKKYGAYLNAVIRESSLEDAYQRVCHVVSTNQKRSWLPRMEERQRLV